MTPFTNDGGQEPVSISLVGTTSKVTTYGPLARLWWEIQIFIFYCIIWQLGGRPYMTSGSGRGPQNGTSAKTICEFVFLRRDVDGRLHQPYECLCILLKIMHLGQIVLYVTIYSVF